MLSLGSGCKYRLSLAERFDHTKTIMNQLLTDSYQNPTNEWQVTIRCIWWQALQQQVSWCASIVQLHLVAGFKSESDIYFSLYVARPLFYLPFLPAPLSHTVHLSHVTVLASPHADPSQNEHKTSVAGEFLWKRGIDDEIAEGSKTAKKERATLKRKYQESDLN